MWQAMIAEKMHTYLIRLVVTVVRIVPCVMHIASLRYEVPLRDRRWQADLDLGEVQGVALGNRIRYYATARRDTLSILGL